MSKDVINILDLVDRKAIPEPWAEGDNIPWSEPGFSARMLKEHLSQAHDMAGRRFKVIDKHVGWIHHNLLKGEQSKILDLGCGSGFYTSRLAALGHECVGIDYSPASIKHAPDRTEEEKLSCKYLHADLRKADFGTGFDLVMLIFGELNVFRPEDARAIVNKANNALSENGTMLLEPHSFDAVKGIGESQPSWHSAKSGLFSEKPYMYFDESFWDEQSSTSTKRFFVIDALNAEVERYAATYQAYTKQQYRVLLEQCGFEEIEFFPMLANDNVESQGDLIAIVAKKCENETI